MRDPAPHPHPRNTRTHTPGPLHAQLVVSYGRSRGEGRKALLFFREPAHPVSRSPEPVPAPPPHCTPHHGTQVFTNSHFVWICVPVPESDSPDCWGSG